MEIEVSRQLVHLSGLLFILLAQFVGGLLTAFYFFMIALSFFIYSEYIRREERRLGNFIRMFESRFRDFVAKLERKNIARPFTGAIWFYLSCGLAFLIFPLPMASAAGAMLAVGDSLSTIIGTRFGKHRILGNKTLEGSLVLVIASFFVSLVFVNPYPALFGSITAGIAELIPEIKRLRNLKESGWLDDNLLIPLLAGLVMYVAAGFI